MNLVTPSYSSSPWLIPPVPAVRSRQLYCFPYAGGSASSFANWQKHLGALADVYGVQLPGRGTRFSEPPLVSMDHVVTPLAECIAQDVRGPFFFFGHSLGALVAFEVSRKLQAWGLPPEKLFVSGCNSPPLFNLDRGTMALDDHSLTIWLRKNNGTPTDVLENREFMELLIPLIRADLHMARSYTYRPGPALQCPIIVLNGTGDFQVSPDKTNRWAEETASPCRTHSFEGDHFFINTQLDAVIACLKREMATST